MNARRLFRRALDVLAVALGVLAFVYLVQVGRQAGEAKTAPSAKAATTKVPNPNAAKATKPSKGVPTIRIGWTAWSDAELVTRLARRVLEDRMGYHVRLVMADIGVQYQGVASGDLDAMLMAWLPVTHAAYWTKFSDSLVNLGPLYTRARLGWAVPSYVPKQQVASFDDLRDPEVERKLGGRIFGIDPGSGLMQASEQAMKAYGLDRLELVSSSGAAMTAALERAIRQRRWIVVTAWSPHWMFARWDLRYLDDPKRVMGGRERVHALVRRGFYQDFPSEVTEMLTRMYLPIDELEQALLYSTQHSVDEAVDRYLHEHARRIDYWVTGDVE